MDDLVRVLRACEGTLKGVSLLPLEKDVYEQMPYTPLTVAEYDKAIARIKTPFHLTGEVKGLHEVDSSWCDNDGCITPAFAELLAGTHA